MDEYVIFIFGVVVAALFFMAVYIYLRVKFEMISFEHNSKNQLFPSDENSLHLARELPIDSRFVNARQMQNEINSKRDLSRTQ